MNGTADTASILRRRLLGLLLLASIGSFMGLSIASYTQSFDDVVNVDLTVDSIGGGLPSKADVKVRGLIVGEVTSTSSVGGVVTVHMAIDRDKSQQIPSNTTARVLPKTLFGERYISLTIPLQGASGPIEDGSVLMQDASGSAVEASQVIESMRPLFDAIPPQDLSSTLGALAQGLSGKGAQLGKTVDQLQDILEQVNSDLPDLRASLTGLAEFSQTTADAGPQLVDALGDFAVTGNTVVEQQPSLNSLISSLTSTSSSAAGFLESNETNLVRISADSTSALELLAEYSPSFGCAFSQFVPMMEQARVILRTGQEYRAISATVEMINPKGRYLPNQDEPRFFDNRGPRCYTPTDPASGETFPQYPGGSANDGSYQPPTRNAGPQDVSELPSPQFSPLPNLAHSAPLSYVGSEFERDTVAVIYGLATGTPPDDVPAWVTSAGASALRGANVVVTEPSP